MDYYRQINPAKSPEASNNIHSPVSRSVSKNEKRVGGAGNSVVGNYRNIVNNLENVQLHTLLHTHTHTLI